MKVLNLINEKINICNIIYGFSVVLILFHLMINFILLIKKCSFINEVKIKINENCCIDYLF